MSGTTYLPEDLPNGMIGLNTTAGKEMLSRTTIVNDLMIDRFSNQINRTFCGPASLAVLINALNVAYRIKYKEAQGDKESEGEFFKQAETGSFRVTENDIVNLEDVKEYISSDTDIAKNGLTLRQMENIVGILGFGVNTYFACGNGTCDNDQIKQELKLILQDPGRIFHNTDGFRRFAADYIKRAATGVIVNYDMSLLGYKNLNGHYSPLAAYEEQADMFLVMDVWPDTPPAWVKAEILFNAMSTLDNASKLPRGLLHIHELLY